MKETLRRALNLCGHGQRSTFGRRFRCQTVFKTMLIRKRRREKNRERSNRFNQLPQVGILSKGNVRRREKKGEEGRRREKKGEEGRRREKKGEEGKGGTDLSFEAHFFQLINYFYVPLQTYLVQEDG